jgi:hypothetical protein
MNLISIIKQELERGKVITPFGEEIPFVFTQSLVHEPPAIYRSIERGANYCLQDCDFFVAPGDPFFGKDELLKIFFKGRGLIQYIDGLNLLLDNLLPNLQHVKKKSFDLGFEQFLYYGSLSFSETIGKCIVGKEVLTVNDEDFQNRRGFSDGKIIFPQIEIPLYRHVLVRVYPHKVISHICRSCSSYEGWSQSDFSDSDKYARIDCLRAFLRKQTKA